MISLKIKELNQKAATANSGTTAKKSNISESEWCGLRKTLKKYGVDIEGPGKYGNFKNVLGNVNKGLNSGCMISVINANGEEEQVELNQAIADSYDSVLDLVLKEKLRKVLGSGNWNIGNYIKNIKQDDLRKAGIEFTVLGDRIYTFSLVDDDGNVIQDENGKLAQIIMTDKVLPDGCMQGTDKNWNAVLDSVGYNCVSELDYTQEEWAQIQQLAELDNSELGISSGKKTTDVYKNAKVVDAGHFGGTGGSSSTTDMIVQNLSDDDMFDMDFEQEETTALQTETTQQTAKKASEEKAKTEETEATEDDKDGRTSVSQLKYNALVDEEVQTASKEYANLTGGEIDRLGLQIYRQKAEEEINKKYVVA